MKVILRKDVTTEPVDEGLLILDKQAEKIHQLNAAAAAVWLELEKTGDTADAASLLVEKFDTTLDTATRDVGHIVESFKQQGLIEEGSSN